MLQRPAALQRCAAPGRLAASDGGIAGLKWLGLVLMTLDHLNKYLWQGRYDWLYDSGRLVMPLFSFVLAYNLARPQQDAVAAASRVARRSWLFGMLATPAAWLLNGPWPLNILFTLGVAATVIALLQRRRPLAAGLVGLAGGFMVEFWWPAIGATVAAWCFCRSPSWAAALSWAACLGALGLINGNGWACACLPLIALAAACSGSRWRPVPRMRWFFYAYYPAHLSAISLAVLAGWP